MGGSIQHCQTPCATGSAPHAPTSPNSVTAKDVRSWNRLNLERRKGRVRQRRGAAPRVRADGPAAALRSHQRLTACHIACCVPQAPYARPLSRLIESDKRHLRFSAIARGFVQSVWVCTKCVGTNLQLCHAGGSTHALSQAHVARARARVLLGQSDTC